MEWFAVAAVVLVTAGAPFYFRDILRGSTKPHRSTWFIWSLQGVVAFVSQAMLGGHWSLVYIGIEALGNIVVFLLSLRYGVGGWSRTDRLALAVALVGIAISLLARQPVIAILGVILADFCGLLITLHKAYKSPESETVITWLAISTAGLLTAFSVGRWSIDLLLYPVYLAVSCFSVAAAVWVGRLAKKT